MTKFHAFWAAVALAAATTAAGAADGDSRPPTLAEQRVFFPLVCGKPVRHDKDDNCARILGYPGTAPGGDAVSISLDAVAYGAFTHAGAVQAYLTYAASFEPHADNFGGGILFERAGARWRLKRWYPGGQMENCLALPGAPQRMLCLTGWAGQGEIDSSVWIDRVPDSDADGAFAHAASPVLRAQDARQTGVEPPAGNYQCTLKRKPGAAILLSVDDLTRAPNAFAQSHVTYVAARDAAAACRSNGFADAKETKGVVRYELRGGRAVAITPVPFAAPDY